MAELEAKGTTTMTPKQLANEITLLMNPHLRDDIEQAIAAAVTEEREGCREIARNIVLSYTGRDDGAVAIANEIDTAIRARGHG